MARSIDLTGLACPLPVIRTKEALEGGDAGEFMVVVDNETARNNVSRFAQGRGCTVSVARAEHCLHLTIKPGAGKVSDIFAIPEAQMQAGRIIKP